MKPNHKIPAVLAIASMIGMSVVAATRAAAHDKHGHSAANVRHVSAPFEGVKVKVGRVTHEYKDGKHTLTWSDDFQLPDTPAPHWQVVDDKGHVHLLQRLKIKNDKLNRTITLPPYIHQVKKVQIWCAWAEALLGEAAFESSAK